MTIVKVEKHLRGRKPVIVYETEINANKAYEVGFACGLIVGYLEMIGHSHEGWHLVTKPHYENKRQFLRGYQVGWTYSRTYHVHKRATQHAHSQEGNLNNVVEHYLRTVAPQMEDLIEDRVPVDSHLHAKLRNAERTLAMTEQRLHAIGRQHEEQERFMATELQRIQAEKNRAEEEIRAEISAKAGQFGLQTENIAQLRAGAVIALMADKLEALRREKVIYENQAADALQRLGRRGPRGDDGDAKGQLIKANEHAEHLQRQIAQLEQEKESLNQRLGETERTKGEMVGRLTVNELALKRAQASVTEAEQMLTVAQNDIRRYEDDEQRLVAELAELKQQYALLTQQYESSSRSKEAEIAKLRAEIQVLGNSNAKVPELEARINELVAALQEENARKQARGKGEEEAAGGDVVMQELSDGEQQQKLQEEAQARKVLEDRINELTSQLTAVQGALDGSRTMYEAGLKTQKEKYEAAMAIASSKHKKEVIELEEALSKALDHNRDIAQQMGEARAGAEQAAKWRADCEAKMNEISSLKILLANAQEAVGESTELKRQLEAAQFQLAAMESKARQTVSQEEYAKLKTSLAATAKREKELEAKVQRYMHQAALGGNDVAKLSELNNGLQNDVKTLQQEIFVLKQENAGLANTNLEQASTAEARLRRVRELEEQLLQMGALSTQVNLLLQARTEDAIAIKNLREQNMALQAEMQATREDQEKIVAIREEGASAHARAIVEQYRGTMEAQQEKEAQLRQEIAQLHQALAVVRENAAERERIAHESKAMIEGPKQIAQLGDLELEKIENSEGNLEVAQFTENGTGHYNAVMKRLAQICQTSGTESAEGKMAMNLAIKLPKDFEIPNQATAHQLMEVSNTHFLTGVEELMTSIHPELRKIVPLEPDDEEVVSGPAFPLDVERAVRGIARHFIDEKLLSGENENKLHGELVGIVNENKEVEANTFIMRQLMDLTRAHPALLHAGDVDIIQEANQPPGTALNEFEMRVSLLASAGDVAEAKERLSKMRVGLARIRTGKTPEVYETPVPKEVLSGEALPLEAPQEIKAVEAPPERLAIEAPPPERLAIEAPPPAIKTETKKKRGGRRKQTSSDVVRALEVQGQQVPEKPEVMAVLSDIEQGRQDVRKAQYEMAKAQNRERERIGHAERQPPAAKRLEKQMGNRRWLQEVPESTHLQVMDEEEQEPWRPLPKHTIAPLGDVNMERVQEQFGVVPNEEGHGLKGGALGGPGEQDSLLMALRSLVKGAPLPSVGPPAAPSTTNFEQRFQALRSVPLMIAHNGRILSTYYRFDPKAPQPKVYKDINVARYFNPKTATSTINGNTADAGETLTLNLSLGGMGRRVNLPMPPARVVEPVPRPTQPVKLFPPQHN